MAKKFQLSAVIRAVDNVTRPVAQATAGIRRATTAITKFNNRMRASARAAGLDKLVAGTRRLGSSVKRAGVSFARMGAKIGIVVGAFALLVRRSAQTGDTLIKTARGAGLSVEVLSRLALGANRAGIDTKGLAKGLSALTKNMDLARQGTGEAFKSFKKFSIEVADSSGELRNTEDVLKDIADQFAKLPDGPEKTAAAINIFGARAGPQLINFLNAGSKGIAELSAEAERMGVVWDTKAAEGAEKFNDAMADVGSALEGVSNTITQAILPVLTPMILNFKELVIANRELIATKVKDFLSDFGKALKAVFEFGKKVLDKLDPLIKLVGGPGNAAFLLLAATIVGPTVGALVGMVASTVKLAFTFGKVLLVSLQTLIPIIIKFGIALLTTPIGQIALAIGVLIFIFKKMNDAVQLGGGWGLVWEGFKITVDEVTESIVGSIRSVIDWIIRMSKIIAEKAGAFAAFIPGIGPAIELISRLSPSDSPGPSGSARPSIPQQGRAGAQGQVDLNVKLSGLPRGTTTDVTTNGDSVNLSLEQGVVLVAP